MESEQGLAAYRQYEEIGASPHSKVYKARKRLGIEFVALRKVDKSRQPKLINEVRALRELHHANVTAFHGWYYTERHLWMVTEYCAGGDLATLLAHDEHLPEPTVVSLGLDALAALQHVHSHDFLVVNLTPSAFLLNESGLLKLADLGSSCHISEMLAPPLHRLLAALGRQYAPSYLAPELFPPPSGYAIDEELDEPGSAGSLPFSSPRPCFSKASDFWGLGALLYHLAAGTPPFGPPAPLPARLFAAATQSLPPLHGASEAFISLLDSLLQKDPEMRPSWDAMRAHDFWSGCLRPISGSPSHTPTLRSAGAQVEQQEDSHRLSADGNPFDDSFAYPLDKKVDLTRPLETRERTDADAETVKKGELTEAESFHSGIMGITRTTKASKEEVNTPNKSRDAQARVCVLAEVHDGCGVSAPKTDTPRTRANPKVSSRVSSYTSPMPPLPSHEETSMRTRSTGTEPLATPRSTLATPIQQQSSSKRGDDGCVERVGDDCISHDTAVNQRVVVAAMDQKDDKGMRSTPTHLKACVADATDAEAMAVAKEMAAAEQAAVGPLEALSNSARPEMQDAQRAAAANLRSLSNHASMRASFAMEELLQAIFHPSEWFVRPIALNPAIEPPTPVERLDPRALLFKPMTADALLAMRPDQIEAALTPIARSLGGGIPGVPSNATTSAEKSNAVLYIESLSSDPRAATLLLNSRLATVLLRLLRSAPSASLRLRIASLCAALIRHATLLDRTLIIEDLLPALLTSLGDRSEAVRRRTSSALGEVIYYIAIQQEHALSNGEEPRLAGVDSMSAAEALAADASRPIWEVPVAVFDSLVGALRSNDVQTQHYAVKTIENVLLRSSEASSGTVAEALCTEEVSGSLFAFLGRRSAQSKSSAISGTTTSRAPPPALRASAAAAVAHLLRLRPRLATHIAADPKRLNKLVNQICDGSNVKPAQAAATCFLLILSNVDARQTLDRIAPESLRCQTLDAAISLTKRPEGLLQAKGFLIGAFIATIGPAWLNYAVTSGLMSATCDFLKQHLCARDPSSKGTSDAVSTWRITVDAPASEAHQTASITHTDAIQVAGAATTAEKSSASQHVSSCVYKMLLSRVPSVLHLVANPWFSSALASGHKVQTLSPKSIASDSLVRETLDTEVALTLLLDFTLCGLASSTPVASATASALAACLHALCRMKAESSVGYLNGVGHGVDEGQEADKEATARLTVAVRLALSVTTRLVTALNSSTHAMLADYTPHHLSSSGLFGAICRAIGAWPDPHTRLEALQAAAALAQMTFLGSSKEACLTLSATIVSHLLPYTFIVLAPAIPTHRASLRHPSEVGDLHNPLVAPTMNSTQMEPSGVTPCFRTRMKSKIDQPLVGAESKSARPGTRRGTLSDVQAPSALEPPRALLLLLAALATPPAELARLLEELALVPLICRALSRLSSDTSSGQNDDMNICILSTSPDSRRGEPERAYKTPQEFAPLLRVLAERPAVSIHFGLVPMLASILPPSGFTQSLSLGESTACDVLHSTLDASYLLLCFGVSTCRQLAKTISPPSPSTLHPDLSPPFRSLGVEYSSARAYALETAAKLRPLTRRATILLELFAAPPDACLAEKAVHCLLQVCEVLLLTDPQSTVATVLGGDFHSHGRSDGARDLAQARLNGAKWLHTALKSVDARSALGRYIGRVVAVLRECDEVSFDAAVAAIPGLESSVLATIDNL